MKEDKVPKIQDEIRLLKMDHLEDVGAIEPADRHFVDM
jgi:hypothetical protein